MPERSYKITETDGSTSYVREEIYSDGSKIVIIENSRGGTTRMYYGTDGQLNEVRRY